jgi:hypothetical protein
VATYGKTRCPRCGAHVTTNALGRAAHMRSDKCSRHIALWTRTAEEALAYIDRYATKFDRGCMEVSRSPTRKEGYSVKFVGPLKGGWLSADGFYTGRTA